MSEASGDPLYRSDTRTAPTGSQQADLAPVNDQPEEHWEQQAEARETEGPAPLDPMGAQPASVADDTAPGDGAPQTTSAQAEEAATTTSAPSQSPEAAANMPDASPPQPEESHVHDDDSAIAVHHGASVSVGAESAWTDPDGGHARSGEVSVDVSQATPPGNVLSSSHEAVDEPVAQGALMQAAAAANGAIALVQADLASAPLMLVPDLASSLEVGASALQQAEHALDDVQSSVSPLAGTVAATAADPDALLSGTVADVTSQVTDALEPGDIVEQASDDLTAIIDDPLEDIAVAGGGLDAPFQTTAGPTGLLASLFTPQDSDSPTDSLIDAGLPDALGGLDAGGLLASGDDHPHLDLPGL